MKQIIITGHGEYSYGVLSSIETILGPNFNVCSIDFKDDTNLLINSYIDKINESNEVIFICDLIGGTPFKEACKLAYNKENIKVIAGCNVGAMIDTIIKLDNLSMEETINNLVEMTKKNVIVFGSMDTPLTNNTDGI